MTKPLASLPHPMQPIGLDEHGVARFKPNAIVQYLLDHGGYDLNDLSRLRFSNEDWAQFAQLIGYSVSGWGDLSYVPLEQARVADAAAQEVGA